MQPIVLYLRPGVCGRSRSASLRLENDERTREGQRESVCASLAALTTPVPRANGNGWSDSAIVLSRSDTRCHAAASYRPGSGYSRPSVLSINCSGSLASPAPPPSAATSDAVGSQIIIAMRLHSTIRLPNFAYSCRNLLFVRPAPSPVHQLAPDAMAPLLGRHVPVPVSRSSAVQKLSWVGRSALRNRRHPSHLSAFNRLHHFLPSRRH